MTLPVKLNLAVYLSDYDQLNTPRPTVSHVGANTAKAPLDPFWAAAETVASTLRGPQISRNSDEWLALALR